MLPHYVWGLMPLLLFRCRIIFGNGWLTTIRGIHSPVCEIRIRSQICGSQIRNQTNPSR
jgi:hypothetical protein